MTSLLDVAQTGGVYTAQNWSLFLRVEADMARASIAILIFYLCAISVSPGIADRQTMVAQLDCNAAGRLYAQAHQATCLHEYERALEILQQVRSSVPRQCRFEPDEMLDRYMTNIKSFIARQRAGEPPTPCQPLRTGPTSYSCGVSKEIDEEEQKRCRAL